MSNFPIAEAQLVSLFLETVFYGIFLATFCECLRALLWHKDSFRANTTVRWALLAIAVSMALIGSTDVILNLLHNLEAFIFYTGSGGATGEFSDISYWINVARGVTLALQMMIGDGMLVYRIYIVFARSIWITAFPLLLWFGLGIALMAIPYSEAAIKGNALLTVSSLNNWTNATVVLTLVLNVLGTVMIAYRIWSVSKRTSAMTPTTPTTGRRYSPLENAMRIIIESGLIYTVSIIALFISSFAQSNTIYGISDSVVQIIGICFNLIILRVNWYTNQAQAAAAATDTSASIPIQLRSARTKRTTMGPDTVQHVPVEVSVTRDIEFDGGSFISSTDKAENRESWVR